MKLVSKCGCQSATRCSSGVLTPLKIFVKNMLTHVHKVVYLWLAHLIKGDKVDGETEAKGGHWE
jgi:hypothetical protein